MGKLGILTKKLDDIVDIQVGYQHKGQMTNDPVGSLSVIQVLNLNHDLRMLDASDLWKISSEKDFSKYEVTESDLLYLSRGTKFGAYLIPEMKHPTIPLSHFFILRPRENEFIDKAYLWWVLNEKRTAKQVQTLMKGSMMPFISRNDLGQIEIPIPSKESQKMIVEFASLRTDERKLILKLEAAKEKLYEAALEKIVYEEHLSDFIKDLRKL